MENFEGFYGQKNGYSRSITLRNSLIPVGKTAEKIKEANLLNSDFKRASAYENVKEIIDDYHRLFIEEILSKANFDWNDLFVQFDLFQKTEDKNKKEIQKKELLKKQGEMRKKIVKAFKDDERYKKLFEKELFSDLLCTFIKNDLKSSLEEKKQALDVFKGFSTYFKGFHENRKNIYSEEDKATAISNRIVNENFSKFYSNIKTFEDLNKNFPQIIEDTENSLKDFLCGKKLSDIFSPENFNKVLSQSGIDFYNTVIGGITAEEGKEKIQGLNEKINLASQKLPAEEKGKLRKKMLVLYKQILSDRKTVSFIPAGFENSEEVYSSLKKFSEEILSKVSILIEETFSKKDYENSKIFVPAKELTAFSLSIFGNWSILTKGLFLLEKDKAKKALTEKQEETLNKEIAKKDYPLTVLQSAFERWKEEFSSEENEKTLGFDNVNAYFTLCELRTNETTKQKEVVNIQEKVKEALEKIDFEKTENLQAEKEAAVPIKNFLDEVQSLYHYLKLVDYRGDEEKETDFYSKLDEILSLLFEITFLYNKVRNFVTKKNGEINKVKLNFDCPTLADGWDLNKESSNDAVLFKKDGNYYLGIFNPKNKPKFSDENSSTPNTCNINNQYEKMVYKFFKDVTTMIPKCSTQRKDVKNHFENSDNDFILENKDFNSPLVITKEIFDLNNVLYDGKKKFQIDYLRNTNDKEGYENAVKTWINFCMDFMKKYKSTSVYDYSSLGDCSQFKQVDKFYTEINLLLYKIWFVSVSEEKINSFVDSGKLYLFQIYNKDFAEKASGNKNLHTMYFENIFSEENLKDVCIKLNGEAELFYRPANKNIKIITHEKGSVLVNRTTTDGKTIPEEIYQQIYQFKNPEKRSKDFVLGDEAKELLDSGRVICKEAKHTLVKDKHFTEEKYLFHCPVTLNFKAPDLTGRKFNEKVQKYLNDNPDVKIIGLDRGERHLIYLSLINQKGEIELQKTLNLVEQKRNDKNVLVNYHEKLAGKELERDRARKNWQTIGNIKELKEGYLSAVVHEIAKLMVEHNAIIVMEDLNFGFKRGRFHVEKQVYQKFENMLIEKLNYLVFKDRDVLSPGGILNAYQLTDKAVNVKDVGKQCGFIFYVQAAYTSKIDPKTGFANLFSTAGLTNVEKKQAFFKKFDGIHYDSQEDSFVFTFDYSKFGDNADFKKKWQVYTKGERILYNREERKFFSADITERFKKLFTENAIEWKSGKNFIEELVSIKAEKANAFYYDSLLRNFNATLQMRNSKANTQIDYLVSPVKADDGTFFDSRLEAEKVEKAKLPVDADANGAYHIALKGLYFLKNNLNLNEKGYINNISNSDWFKFVQNREWL